MLTKILHHSLAQYRQRFCILAYHSNDRDSVSYSITILTEMLYHSLSENSDKDSTSYSLKRGKTLQLQLALPLLLPPLDQSSRSY
jgi:hypothetical protein